MKSFFLAWLLIAISLAGIGAGAGKAQPPAVPALEGSWTGTLGQGPDAVRLTVTIFRAANGQIQGMVTGVPGNSDIAIETVERSGNIVRMTVGGVSGNFEGTLSADGTRLTGTWTEIAIGTPLELFRSSASPPPAVTAAPH